MEAAFELLREVGFRLGQQVSPDSRDFVFDNESLNEKVRHSYIAIVAPMTRLSIVLLRESNKKEVRLFRDKNVSTS